MAKAVEPLGRPHLVARRHHLHWRDLQGQSEADVRAGAALDDPAGLFNASLEGTSGADSARGAVAAGAQLFR